MATLKRADPADKAEVYAQLGLLLPTRIPRRPHVLGGASPQGIPRCVHPAQWVWQTDVSEFETAGGGIWRICAVIDYATNDCLTATITPTGRGVDAPCLKGVLNCEVPSLLC